MYYPLIEMLFKPVPLSMITLSLCHHLLAKTKEKPKTILSKKKKEKKAERER